MLNIIRFKIYIVLVIVLLLVAAGYIISSKHSAPKQEQVKTPLKEAQKNTPADQVKITVKPPTNLVSTLTSDTIAVLSWNASEAQGSKTYVVYENSIKIGETTSNVYIAKDLKPATEYRFTVKTKDFEGNLSEDSNIITFSTDSSEAVNNKDLNSYIMRVVSTYEIGKYPYLLNDDYQHYNGVTQDIVYQGTTMAKANPDGSKSSHCVGLTFEVFFKAMQERNKALAIPVDNFNDMSVDNMRDFLLTWYNAKGTSKQQGDQLAGAIVKYGLGKRITNLEEAEAGDFIDFSRARSGHTVVFISWIRDSKRNIIGIKYWSTQESTNGINFKEEYFNDNTGGNVKGSIDRKQLFIGRVGPINNYKSF